jgi:hypothetical protein
MSLGAYLTGFVVLAVVVAAPTLATRELFRVTRPFDGPVALLAEVVVVLGLVVVTAELMGTIGQLTRVGLLVGTVAVSGGTGLLARRVGGRRTSPLPVESTGARALGADQPRWAIGLAALVVAVVVAAWLSHVVTAFRHGITDFDSLAYHLPIAGQFAHTHLTTKLSFLGIDPIQGFHTENVELLHAIGIVAFGRDVLSPLLNMGWLALALFAAWCAGQSRRVGAIAVVAAAAAAAIPVFVQTNAGTAGTDIGAFALELAALALLLAVLDAPRSSLAAIAIVGLTAGSAIGAKENAVTTIAVLLIALVLAAPRAARFRCALVASLGALAGGGYWFARNLVRAGSPLPSLRIAIGPLHFPSPDLPFVRPNDHKVIEYITSRHIISTVYRPAFEGAFGRAALEIGAFAVVAIVLALVTRGPARLVAITAIVSAVAYAVTPLTAFGPKGSPALPAVLLNLRYVAGAFAFAGVAGALAVAGRRRAATWALLLVIFLTVATLSTPGSAEWSEARRTQLALVVMVVCVGAAAAWLAMAHARLGRLVVITTGIVGLVAGLPLSTHYLDHRYRDLRSVDPIVALVAKGVHHTRIGVTGLQLVYPLLGPHLDNTIDYVGERLPHGGQVDYATCAAWRAAVNRAGDALVIVGDPESARGRVDTPAIAWAASDPALVPLAAKGTTHLYRVASRSSPQAC